MNKKEISGALMIFGNTRKMSERIFIKQSGLTKDKVEFLIKEKYLIRGKTSDDEEQLTITEKGRNAMYG